MVNVKELWVGRGYLFVWPIVDSGCLGNLFENSIICASLFSDTSGAEMTRFTFKNDHLVWIRDFLTQR